MAKKAKPTRRTPRLKTTSRTAPRGSATPRRPGKKPAARGPAFTANRPDPASVVKGPNSIKFYTTGFFLPLRNPRLSGGPPGSAFTITDATLVGAATSNEHVLVRFAYASKKQKSVRKKMRGDELTITIDSGSYRNISKRHLKIAYPPIDTRDVE